MGQIEEPGQTADRIAEFESAKLPVERASGLRRINDNDAHGVTTSAAAAGFAAEGMLRSTH